MHTIKVKCCGRTLQRTVSGRSSVTIRCPSCKTVYKFS